MAQKYGNKKTARQNRSHIRSYGSSETGYVDGNTVRVREPAAQAARPVSEQTIRNRERSLRMNLGYVLFLTVAAVICVTVCVNYLKLQSAYTALQKNATRMESRLNNLRLENDMQYNRIMSSVNLEEIRETAINRLGMVYAKQDQIETYNASGNDYVKQYRDVPDR